MNLPNLAILPGNTLFRLTSVKAYRDDPYWIEGKVDTTFVSPFLRSGFDYANDTVVVHKDSVMAYDDGVVYVPYYNAPLSVVDGNLSVNYAWIAVGDAEVIDGPVETGRFTRLIRGKSALSNMYVADGTDIIVGGSSFTIQSGGKIYYVLPMFLGTMRYYAAVNDPKTHTDSRPYGRVI